MCFSYMHILCFIKDVGIDGCIHPPCVSNELDQYLKGTNKQRSGNMGPKMSN